MKYKIVSLFLALALLFSVYMCWQYKRWCNNLFQQHDAALIQSHIDSAKGAGK